MRHLINLEKSDGECECDRPNAKTQDKISKALGSKCWCISCGKLIKRLPDEED
jgi:hypothetical protein